MNTDNFSYHVYLKAARQFFSLIPLVYNKWHLRLLKFFITALIQAKIEDEDISFAKTPEIGDPEAIVPRQNFFKFGVLYIALDLFVNGTFQLVIVIDISLGKYIKTAVG